MGLQEQIINSVDLMDFVSEYAGVTFNNHRCKCPIHNGENESSFFVNNDKQIYYCYACGSGGNVIKFVADMENLSYMAAMEKLAGKLNIDYKSDKSYITGKQISESVTAEINFAKKKLPQIVDYLKNDRGLSDQTIEEFEFGYNGNLIFPIHDLYGRPVATAQRQFNKKPKYINSFNNDLFDKSATLFNMHRARKIARDRFILVEGYMDAISANEQGLPAVAYMSANITKEQVLLLDKTLPKDTNNIIISPDNDEEGLKRIEKFRSRFLELAPRFNVRVMIMPNGIKDLNDAHVAGLKIAEMSTEHIDTYVLNTILSKCYDKEEEYLRVAEFMRTVKNPMIRYDLSIILSKWWDKPIDKVNILLDVTGSSEEDVLSEFHGVDSCYKDMVDMINKGGYKFGWANVDKAVQYYRKQQVIIVGAPPYTGKTDFMAEMVLNAIFINKFRILVFSLEMPAKAFFERLVCKIIGINHLELPNLIKTNAAIYDTVKEKLDKYLMIIDRAGLTMTDIDKRIKLANTRVFDSPLDMVFVDYFGYIKGTTTTEDASASARMMKEIAKNNNIVFVMLAQLNREANNYEEASMKNLKLTGDLEASADIVFLLSRPELHPKITLEEMSKLKNKTMLKIEKVRDGIFGPTRIWFIKDDKTSRFSEIGNS